MALFFHTKHKKITYIMRGSNVQMSASGRKKIVRHPKKVRFKGGRYQTESKAEIDFLMNHRDYGTFLFMINEKEEQRRVETIKAGVPYVFACPFCKMDCKTKDKLAIHVPECEQNPVNIDEGEAMKSHLQEEEREKEELEEDDEGEPIENFLPEDPGDDDEQDLESLKRHELLQLIKKLDIKTDANPFTMKKGDLIKVIQDNRAEEVFDEQAGDSATGSE